MKTTPTEAFGAAYRRVHMKLVVLCVVGALSAAAQEYALGPDSQIHPGVPRGEMIASTK